MKVFFRADASVRIGTGHVMRCLVLANALRARGSSTAFVCRRGEGDMSALFESKGQAVLWLPPRRELSWVTDAQDTGNLWHAAVDRPDWIVVDHYGLGEAWERGVRPAVGNVMVIDDLANRRHDCDILLDQNYHERAEQRYAGLLPEHCKGFFGPRYALLRDEFRQARRALGSRDGKVRRLLLFFGGTDPTNETAKALQALSLMGHRDFVTDVVVGGANPFRDAVKAMCQSLEGVEYHCQVENMAQMMASADLALGAGGSSTWERCYLGLPTITVITAENQSETTRALALTGAIWDLGWHQEVTVPMLADAVKQALQEPQKLLAMGQRAIDVMGGAYTDGLADLLEALEQRQTLLGQGMA